MKTQQFDNLMEKYGNEAEAEKLEEIRLARRAQTMARIRKGVMFVFMGCAAFAGYHFRGEIKAAYDKRFPKAAVTQQESIPSDPNDPLNSIQAGAKTKDALRAVKASTEKRNAEVEAAFK